MNLFLELVVGDHSEIGRGLEWRIPKIIKEITDGNHPINQNILLEEKLSCNLYFENVEDRIGAEDIIVNLEDDELTISMNSINLNYKYACYLYLNDEILEKQSYRKNPIFKFKISKIGKYRAVWYIEDLNKRHKLIYLQIKINANNVYRLI